MAIKITYGFLIGLLMTGCVHYQPAIVSTTSIGEQEIPLKVTYGESSAYYLFGILGPLGNDSLQAAIEDAQGDAPSDTIVNVFIDRQVLNFPFDYLPLITRIKTNIYGTLIKYKDNPSFKRPVALEMSVDETVKYLKDVETRTYVKITMLNSNVYEGGLISLNAEKKTISIPNASKNNLQEIKLTDVNKIQFFDSNRDWIVIKH
jgi:hypothetical protein